MTVENAAEFRRQLLDLVERLGIGSIFPTGDDILQMLAPVYDELKARVVFCCPDPATYQQVLQKEVTLSIARRLGIPLPLAYEAPDLASLEAQRETIRFPILAKARAVQYQVATGIRAQRFDSFEEIESVFRRIPLFGQLFLIQEYIPGGGVALDVLMRNGEPAMVFQHRRVRELPFTGGVSVAAQSEPVDPGLLEYAVALLRTLDWSGVAMVEFRRDFATGRTVFMEVNGRFWGSLALSIHAGLDFPCRAWEAAHDIDSDVSQKTYGRHAALIGDSAAWGPTARLYGLDRAPSIRLCP
jgi:predicted ATP-grasp superfamily ATP-dependent carboligase